MYSYTEGFGGKPERKRQFDIPKCRCEDNTKLCLSANEVGCAY